jgi:DNA-binding NarL/FixJ family response regulator
VLSDRALAATGVIAGQPTLRVGLVADGPASRRLVEVLGRHGLDVRLLPETDLSVDVSLDAVVVLATQIPLSDGDPAECLARFSGIPVVVVTSSTDRASLDELLRLGACGVIALDELERAAVPTVYAVKAGQTVLPGSYRPGSVRALLSAREKQVLAMVVLGFSNLDVANKLYIAETTVKSHLSSAYRKLGVCSRQQATELILSDSSLGLGILTLSGERTGN